MMDYEPAYSRLALARLSQRNAALLVDFIACAFLGQLIEALLGLSNSGLGLVIFGLAWMLNRVFIAGKNQGQSLGRWLVSIRVVDMMYGKSAGVFELAKREAAIYLCMALVLAGFNSGGLTNTISFFALIPIVIDGIIALADSEKMQTLHDKLSGTIVIVSRKGLQLDQKIAKLLGQASRSASKAYQSGRSGDRPNRGYGQGYGQDYGQGYAQGYDDEFDDDDDYDDRVRGRNRQEYGDEYDVDPYREPSPRSTPQIAPSEDLPNPFSKTLAVRVAHISRMIMVTISQQSRIRKAIATGGDIKAAMMTIMGLVPIFHTIPHKAHRDRVKRKSHESHVFDAS
ncbi:MAG: RDD family protein [Pseudanabaena sp. RU_4_16]|nr:RDD family protein [Pseudanabaena sp. RU_4_16]